MLYSLFNLFHPDFSSDIIDCTEHSAPAQTKTLLQNPLVSTAIAGGIASTLDAGMTHPFLVLKIRYQDPHIPQAAKLTWDPRILTRGLGANMLSMVPNTMIQFTTNQALKMLFHHNEENIPSCNAVTYSGTAGALTAVISTPVEYVIAWQKQDQRFFETANQIWKNRGMKVFSTGLGGTASREAIYACGYLWGAEKAQQIYSPYFSPITAGILGGLTAGVASGLLSQPLDTLKTYQQTGNNPFECGISLKIVTPLWRLAKERITQEGFRSLMKGAIPRTASIAFGTTVLHMVGEKVKARLA